MVLKSPDEIKNISKELADPKSKSEFGILLKNTEKSVNNKIKGFEVNAAGQEIANLLKRPLDNLKSFFGADEETQIKDAWNAQIFPAAKKIEKGYPFDNEGESDLAEVTKYLNPVDGILSKFYKERLQKFFEESNGQLKLKETSAIKFSPEFVTYLNNAFKLREVMFGKSATPSFSYEFKLTQIKEALIDVTIDGQSISKETGSGNFKFPSTTNDTGASMKFVSTTEPTSTSTPVKATPTPNTSANSSPSNVNPISSPTPSKPLPNSGSSQPSEIRFQGTWGLFRFIDASSPPAKKQGGGEYVLTYKLGGKNVSATVKPIGGDLFDKTIFTSARAPQNVVTQK